ncbi:MAG: GntR family transcriptional regulator [Lautropia sp.]
MSGSSVALPLPKYHQIYLVLRQQIEEGQFDDGLPAEIALSRHFDAGRVTVRRALEQLVEEGMIVREPGRGTWPARVRPRAVDPARRESGPQKTAAVGLSGLLENILAMSMRTTVLVREIRLMPAPASIAQLLQIAPGTLVQKAVRRRSTREGPLSLITTHVPEALAAGFGRRELSKKPILQLLQDSGIALGRATQTVSARQADAAVAAELEIAVGTALLAVRRIVRDVGDRPVLLLHGLYRPDRYEYQMEVSKVGSLDARISVNENLWS